MIGFPAFVRGIVQHRVRCLTQIWIKWAISSLTSLDTLKSHSCILAGHTGIEEGSIDWCPIDVLLISLPASASLPHCVLFLLLHRQVHLGLSLCYLVAAEGVKRHERVSIRVELWREGSLALQVTLKDISLGQEWLVTNLICNDDIVLRYWARVATYIFARRILKLLNWISHL